MQVNRYLKQMNGHYPSKERLRMTALGLNQSLDLIRSLRKLRESHVDNEGKLFPGTLHDAELLYLWIAEKIQPGIEENPPIQEWDKHFWQDEGQNTSNYNKEVSLVCEDGSDDIYTWFLRNQKFLSEVHEKISKKNLVNAFMDDELDEAVQDFDY